MEKVLIVVDIQGMYNSHFNEEYINNIEGFLKKHHSRYEDIIGLIDLNHYSDESEYNSFLGDYVPKSIYKYVNTYLFKEYELFLPYDVMESQNIDYTILDSIEYSKEFEYWFGSIFKIYDKHALAKDSFSVSYLTPEVVEKLKNLKGKKISLIGGGLNNCIKVTSDILEALNLDCEILTEYCYKIEDNVEKEKSGFSKESLHDWTYVKNNINSIYYSFYKNCTNQAKN